jgi:ribosomal protein L40E
MAKICKACGTENRDEAAFCRQCGVPLPLKKKTLDDKKLIEYQKKLRKFWITVFTIIGIIGLITYTIIKKIEMYNKVETVKEYTNKYINEDRNAFSGIGLQTFNLQGLTWDMKVKDIMKNFKYAKQSNDPDFVDSLMVSQVDFKTEIPHANFMSLGIFTEKLYAIKFEFGTSREFLRQQVKIPNEDEIMYGRYQGLLKVFKELFGPPTFIKNEIDKLDFSKRLKYLKRGQFEDGRPSNVYIYWILGNTKVEIAFFGYQGKPKLTVRFLYIPVWDKLGGK